MKTALRAMGLRDWAWLLLLSVLWGAAFTLNRLALHDLGPFSVLLGRVTIAAAALLLLLRLTGRHLPRDRRSWLAFAGLATINILVPMSLILYGQTRIPGSLASILNSTTPLLTVVVAHYVAADERLTLRRTLGVLIGFIGVATVIGFDWLSAPGSDLSGHFAVLGASALYACAGLLGRRVTTEPLVTAAGQFSSTVLLALPLVVLVEQPWLRPLPGATALAALLGVGLFSTALAYVIYFRLLAAVGAGNTAMVTYLIPLSALVLGALTGETISAQQLVGLAVMICGLLLLDGRAAAYVRAWRRGRAPAEPSTER